MSASFVAPAADRTLEMVYASQPAGGGVWHRTLTTDPADALLPPPLLTAGNPVGWHDASLNKGIGGTLLEEIQPGESWLVQPSALVGQTPPSKQKVPVSSIRALPNWPFVGVSVACLRDFARVHASLLRDTTTEEICERVIKPLTAAPRASLAECLAFFAIVMTICLLARAAHVFALLGLCNCVTQTQVPLALEDTMRSFATAIPEPEP